MGGVLPKFGYRYLALRRKSVLLYGKPESNYITKRALIDYNIKLIAIIDNLAIMLGTILIDSNWLV